MHVKPMLSAISRSLSKQPSGWWSNGETLSVSNDRPYFEPQASKHARQIHHPRALPPLYLKLKILLPTIGNCLVFDYKYNTARCKSRTAL